MAAQDSLLFGAEANDGATRNVVHGVCLQLEPPTAENVKSMGHEQEFALRVDAAALPLNSDPRPSDFQTLVRPTNRSEARTADRLAGLSKYDRKWQ
jgi:hypothetical protein